MPPALAICPEETTDYSAIYEINCQVFSQINEDRLVDELRELPDFRPQLSLVALLGGRPVSQIFFSPITISAPRDHFSALASICGRVNYPPSFNSI